MRRLFHDFAEGEYDRPNQRYICGQADEACACPFGPTPKGACPELAECQPVKQGDRWRCNRPATRGGPCDTDDGHGGADAGPTPDGQCCRVNKCSPRPSLRVFRGRLAWGSALLVAGALAMLIASPLKTEVLAPGPLTQPHAQLLARGDWQGRCAACHVDQDRPMLLLAVGNLTGMHAASGGTDATQSDLCMNCHQQQLAKNSALLAHGLPAGVLEHAGDDPIACSTCHREHHGAMFDLTAISSVRCQSCHQQQHDSFAGSHPDFGAWPYQRRTRVAFDHVSHMKKHHVEQKQAFDCRACHLESQGSRSLVMANYEAACGSCHDKGIAASSGAGLAIIGLPLLDLDAMEDHGVPIDDWPQQATGDFDGELPAPLKLLLADEPALVALLDKYGAGFSFFDIDPDSADDVRHAAALVAAIRQLIADAESEGQQAWADRLAKVAGHPLTDAQQKTLLAGLPVDLVARAGRGWFSGEEDEDARTPSEQAAKLPAGGWFVSDVALTLGYKPQGHADPLLTGWIELIVSLGDQHHLVREAALAELARPESPGQCLTCHSVEQTPGVNGKGGGLMVNWLPYDATRQPRGFTKFNHGPHITVSELADCTACHQLDASAETSAAYVSTNPRDFVSHFLPMTKADCAACHQPHAAGDNCAQCHNYHVDPLAAELTRTK
ncbi:Doubled CXXCH motif [Posidoniimonas polymericola]|uniref:Doubled CXXCH motif n=1 Tax=Posidoniimonas polymericola TaxID=2528002 RepID=A0A5C5ZEU4_9BACT|nr:cytochrome c3 family protein [Posidoniimonas polymericola]TWT85842.1 Doubled CXXCH motif [Posidoniimonas polymericola]